MVIVTVRCAFGERKRANGKTNIDRLTDLAIAVDVTGYMSERNTRLQDKGLFAHKMYSQVKAFMANVKLLSRQVETNTLTHFPILKDSTLSDDQHSRYASLLQDLHGEISGQSEDFKAVESEMLLVSSPFRCDVDKAISRRNSSTCSQMHF